ncbi:MAG: tetratricopeptide repeat protein [Bacteroidetes bacterium]|nr:tetratricopeptide repeat protein [Bacteroidota bacterium]
MKQIRFSLLAAVVLLSNVAFAQSVEQGKKFLYYQRYKSAKETFEKVLASNPNNIDAVYWLGQTLLLDPDLKDSVGAKALYQKALQTNGSAPLLLVGIGNIELREGKTADARQHFETAISLTKGKDIDILNAVAEANVDAKNGDGPYAIEKLNQATQVKKFNDPETYIIMGDAYRKLIDGGNAVTSYQKALTIDPKLAEAKYKIGKIYLTQNNKDYFLPAFEEATQLDPSYGPAYFELFYYWYYHQDVNKAIGYFDKYTAVTDPKPSDEYNRISFLYAAKKYQDCITQSQQKISAQGANAYPLYYKLIAYCYSDMGDSANAKTYLDQYFAKQKPDGFVAQDYSFYAKTLSKFPGNDSLVNLNYQKAFDTDTALANKQKIAEEAAGVAKTAKDKQGVAKWEGVMYRLNKDPGQAELYRWGYANYSAGNYATSDSIFCGIYEQKYPNEIYGYLWCAKTKRAEDDSLSSGGLAVEPYQKLAEMGKKIDSVKYKSQIVESYFYLASYYNDVKKDKDQAVSYLRKVVEVDPTNETAPKFITILTAPPPKPQPPAAKPKAKKSGK